MTALVRRLAVIGSLLTLVTTAGAATIHVPTQQPTLRAAITAAVSGDEIVLADMTYTGPDNRFLVVTSKSLTIRSFTGDPELCVIDLQANINYAGRAFTFSNDLGQHTTVRGITFINGFMGTSASSDGTGAAIYCLNAAPRFEDCRFVNCEANGHYSADGYGGAVHLRNSEAVFTDCVFENNRADTEGGALWAEDGAPVFSGCTFTGNHSTWGGAALLDGGSPDFFDCGFGLNTSNGSAAAVHMIEACDPTFEDCRFEGNEASTPSGSPGGATESDWSVSPTYTRCRFIDNLAAYEGGAVIADNGSFVDCVFSGNRIWPHPNTSGGYGGGISATGNTLISGCTFVDNEAVYGSAFSWNGAGVLTLERTIISHAPSGGAAHFTASGTMTVTCTNIHGNTGGDWLGDLASHSGLNGNISADPQYCGVIGSHIVTLQSDSPCAPANNTCGVLMGARPVGCATTPNFLASFDVQTVDGEAVIAWQMNITTAPECFRLEAQASGTTRAVAFTAVGPDRFSATHRLPVNAVGGVRYALWWQGDNRRMLLAEEVIGTVITTADARLGRIAPNPFNPRVVIEYELGTPGPMRLEIVDLRGRLVAVLADGPESAGRHESGWDGRDRSGRNASAGTYLARLIRNDRVDSRRIVLVR